MERIILPMKVHAVKLDYRRRLLETMVHGYFGVRKGCDVVIVTRDPNNEKCTPKTPWIYRISSRRGQSYSELVNNYLALKGEYDALLNEWQKIYRMAPPKVNYPIKQFYDPHCMNHDYYTKQEDNLGKYTSDNLTISEYGVFKSKNELMAANTLSRLMIPFKYETELYIVETEETINPDFLLDFYEIDRCAYLDVLGMNDKLSYAVKTSIRINSYSKGRYRPGREIIYVHLYDKSNFDEAYFISQVLSAYNNMIPDSALDWGSGYNPLAQSFLYKQVQEATA